MYNQIHFLTSTFLVFYLEAKIESNLLQHEHCYCYFRASDFLFSLETEAELPVIHIPLNNNSPGTRIEEKNHITIKQLYMQAGLYLGFCSRGGQKSCFRIPREASATCCTLQYIYIVKSQGGGGGKYPANIQQGGGRMPPPPPALKKKPE